MSDSKFSLLVTVRSYDVPMWEVVQYLKHIMPNVGKGEFEVLDAQYVEHIDE